MPSGAIHVGVQVRVVGQGKVDDVVHAVGCACTLIASPRAFLIESDRVSSGWIHPIASLSRVTVPITVAPPQRASCAAMEPTPPRMPWTRTVLPATGPSANTAR